MSRNYNQGSRDMGRAGRNCMDKQAEVGACSYATAATVGERFGQFAQWARDQGVRYMEQIDRALVMQYGEQLQERVTHLDEEKRLSPSTAQNYVSAINTVLTAATGGQWERVSPTVDCGINSRIGIATVSRAITSEQHASLIIGTSERISVQLAIQRELGLRFKESSLIDARSALTEAKATGQVSVTMGTKGGRNRIVPATPAAVAALERAVQIQGRDKSMVPAGMSFADHQAAAYRELAKVGGKGFHGERHYFAQNRYSALVGAPAPVVNGWTRKERIERLSETLGVSQEEARELDHAAREQIAQELGHNREEVSNAYLG